MGEHPYRPLPAPQRMRWTVVRAAFKFHPLGWVIGLSLTWLAREHVERMPWWQVALMMAACLVMARWRLVRVPVEPPRVRVEDDGWDLDTQRRIDALMRAGLVEVETVEMPSAQKGDRRG